MVCLSLSLVIFYLDSLLVGLSVFGVALLLLTMLKQPIELAEAGDIVTIAGMTKATVADTLVAPGLKEPIAQPAVTLSFLQDVTCSVDARVTDSKQLGWMETLAGCGLLQVMIPLSI